MGTESSNPLDELKALDARVDQVQDLEALKPIFARLDELGRQHSGDFEVQLAVTEIKQHVVDRGKLLKFAQTAKPTAPPPASQPKAEPPRTPAAPRVPEAPTVMMPPPQAPAPRVPEAPTGGA